MAKGLIEAFLRSSPTCRSWVRLDGTNDKEGRALLAEANLPNVRTEATMLGAAEKVVELAGLMSILVDGDTRLCVSGMTGREGTFHSLRNRDYGTQVVAGVTPGKGGQDVEGIPVFNTFHDAVAAAGANTAMIFVPPRFARRLDPRRRRTPASSSSSPSPRASRP